MTVLSMIDGIALNIAAPEREKLQRDYLHNVYFPADVPVNHKFFNVWMFVCFNFVI